MPSGKLEGWGSSPLNQGAIKQGSVLSLRERRAMEDAAVASGERKRSYSVNGHGAVRSGDAKRRKEYERAQARQKEGVDKTNELLGGIGKKVDAIADNFS